MIKATDVDALSAVRQTSVAERSDLIHLMMCAQLDSKNPTAWLKK